MNHIAVVSGKDRVSLGSGVVYFCSKDPDLRLVQVAGYLLGEYSHLLARRPGCSPKEVFHIIHDKFPTVTYTLCQCYHLSGCTVLQKCLLLTLNNKGVVLSCCLLSQEQILPLRLLAVKRRGPLRSNRNELLEEV
jgi:hypothetical protein